MKSFITEPERKIPIKEEYDVIVSGGGIAGISAALAAQRAGAKTLLIEKEYSLGGLATLGLVTIYLPICDGFGRQVCFGIAEELSADGDLHLSEKRNGLSLPLELMSRGERALSKLALRFSLADAIGGEPSFLLLDDPFLAVDDEKIGRALGMLSALSKGRQVLYLTCSASRVP